MRLLNLHIENFGKLQNFDLDFKNGLCTLCEKNGFGKTTLACFIKAMFYGMAKKGNNKAYNVERSRYKPWQGGVYGGTLSFECKEGSFKLARTFGDTPEGDGFELYDLTTGLKSDKFSHNVGFELFGVGVETFEITAFFPQLDLGAQINAEVRANLTGAIKFESDLSQITIAQKKISERMRSLKKECLSKNDIEELKEEKNFLERKILALQEEKTSLLEKLENANENVGNVKKELSQSEILRKEISEFNDKKARLDGELFELQSKLSDMLSRPEANKRKSHLPRIAIKWLLIMTALALLVGGTLVALKLLKIISLETALSTGGSALAVYAFVLFLLRDKKREEKQVAQAESPAIEVIQARMEKLKVEKQNLGDEKAFDEEEFSRIQESKFNLESQIAVIKNQLKNLDLLEEEANASLQQVEENILRAKTQDSQARENLRLLDKCLQFMKLAQNNVSARYITPMQEGFDKYFQKLSNQEIKLDVNFDAGVQTGMGTREFEYLSQGYRDAVSVCKRLTLIENIYQKEKPFLIMDDPFVNLDKKNLEIMKTIVSDLSNQYQILYLVCHEKNKI